MSDEAEIVMRAQPKFKAGDTVQLNSGGPAMTVTHIVWASSEATYNCTCIWIDGINAPSALFLEPCLTVWKKR